MADMPGGMNCSEGRFGPDSLKTCLSDAQFPEYSKKAFFPYVFVPSFLSSNKATNDPGSRLK
jgi:hypothetical protein